MTFNITTLIIIAQSNKFLNWILKETWNLKKKKKLYKRRAKKKQIPSFQHQIMMSPCACKIDKVIQL